MRKLLFFVFILIGLWTNAAKPEEVDTVINKINYRLSVVDRKAKVISADKNLNNANLLSSIKYNNVDFSVNEIDNYAFANCHDLQSVLIPNTVTSIGHRTFEYCNNLEQATLPISITEIGNGCFYRCESLLDLIIPDSVITIGANAFLGCKSLTSLSMPSSLSIIYSNAFTECYNLKNIYIDDIASWMEVIEYGLGTNPFRNNGNLYLKGDLIEELTIPEGVTHTANFENCGSIKSVVFPKSLETISGFSSCPNLFSVSIYSSKNVEIYDFCNCQSLNIVNCYTAIPPIIYCHIDSQGVTQNAFSGSYPEYMTLHIPQGTKEIYENAYGWKDFGTIIDDLPNDSGVDEVTIDESKPIEIFNLNGVLVFSGIGDYKLPNGIYIIRQDWKSKKIVIK